MADRDWVSGRQRLAQCPTETGSVADKDWVGGGQTTEWKPEENFGTTGPYSVQHQ